MKYFILFAAAAATLWAQDYYPTHNFTLGVGAAQPRAEISQYSDRPGVSIGYGYRFSRFFQADAGFETVFGAAGIKDFVDTGYGYLRIRDYQFFLPLGGRAILPLAGGRFLISGGGGGAYMRYSERMRQPSDYYRFDCPSCGSRSGWGYYGLFGLSYFLDENQHWRIGAMSRVYRGHTEGDPIGAVSGVRTRDHWVNIFGEFGFSF